ncbi:MAG: mechanosensitive ion channel family protein [Gammaproteobacteria bacterium]|jgi:small-conductance mechanosensitive channel
MDELANIDMTPDLVAWIRAGTILIIGLVLARILSQLAYRGASTPMGPNTAALLRRFVFYGIAVLACISTMRELGFSFSVLLGAAGVFSIALGFASQTSASNLVSGIFLVAEKAFAVGDIIKVGNTTGEVLSIDLLSVKIRTFDNLFIRVPNETLLKGEITNISRLPIRRMDFQIGVAYKEDLRQVHELLVSVADSFELCLDQPRPIVIFQGFGDSSVNLQLSAWSARENFLELRNRIPQRVKQAFDEAGIEIPFPHRTIYPAGSDYPIPIHIDQKMPEEI